MALPPLPSQLKFISSVLARANELEGREPVMAHFCKLHAAQQVLGQGLHLKDNEVSEFASALLDQIEQNKLEGTKLGDDADAQAIINDDQTAYAYVENFALNVFAKADAEVYNKTTSKTTASKFMAAATFLDVLKVFKELEPSIAEKIKYSKFQASRILKAVKEGSDPNDYEPPGQVNQDEEEELEGVGKEQQDEGGIDHHPSQQPVQPSSFLQTDSETDEEGQEQEHDNPVLPNAPPVLPKAPEVLPQGTPTRMLPGGPGVPSAPTTPLKGENGQESAQTPTRERPQPPPPPAAQPQAHAPSKPPVGQTSTKPITKHDVQSIVDESELISSAQKHAKYAISALNYEDKDTAISELTRALEMLRN